MTTSNWVLTGARVLQDGALQSADLALTGGLIADTPAKDAERLDLSGLWLLPGIIDVHGDAIERIIMPRAGVSFPLDMSLQEADRQMLTSGITTAYHGLTISWEPGLRSLDTARAFVAALEAVADNLACDTRINFRWEAFALDAVEPVIDWFMKSPGAIFSLNDHTTANLGLPATSRKITRIAERTGWTAEHCVAELALMSARQDQVPAAIARVAAAAKAAGLPCFAHDELTTDDHAASRAIGITVSEFPMSEAAARAARDGGEDVILGAPNVVRGGSHNNMLDAAPAILAGLGTVLATDYYYPAPLHAAFVLAERDGLPFAKAWDCVSANAARAAGLSDRGRIAPGLRGDIIAVCPRTRAVRAVFVAGSRRLLID